MKISELIGNHRQFYLRAKNNFVITFRTIQILNTIQEVDFKRHYKTIQDKKKRQYKNMERNNHRPYSSHSS